MSNYVVLKRLTLNSDLGWFKSIFVGHNLKTKQKAITLNKEVMNAIYPSLLIRQNAYEAAKTAMAAAKARGAMGKAIFEAEKAKAKAVGTIPVDVELYGPAGKPPLLMHRIIALQDKNWRLNGDFVLDQPTDPTRFHPVLREGDLALISFVGLAWPKATTVLLLSQAADTTLWRALNGLVSKGQRSMIQMDPTDLLSLANSHNLPAGHVVRQMAGPAPAPSPALPSVSVPTKQQKPVKLPTTTPDQLADKLAKAALVGQLGEKMVNAHLATDCTPAQPAHTWVSQTFAEHPYDFELLATDGTVASVIDAKSTSQGWTAEFHMSAAEVFYAAQSPVQYSIYRVSGVASGAGGELRISDDIRGFAEVVVGNLLASPPAGTRATGVAIHPVNSGIRWSNPILLPTPPR